MLGSMMATIPKFYLKGLVDANFNMLGMQRAGRMLRSLLSGSNHDENSRDQSADTDREKLNDSVRELKLPEGLHEFDVIFFHGLQLYEADLKEAYRKTWLSRDGSVVWPKDWLGAKFPNSRIWSISYNSVAKIATEMRLEQITENLFQDIVTFKNRDSTLGGAGQNRPVMLVGHSLGGIIMKKLILYCTEKRDLLRRSRRTSESENTVKQIDNFLGNCRGMFFYSSPFGGARLAQYLQKLPGRNTALVQLLTVFDANTNDINEKFGQIRRPGEAVEKGVLNIETSAVCESKETNYKGLRAKVVEEASLRRDVDYFYTAGSADHIEVCKPCDLKDGIFTRLEEFILHRCKISESKDLTHDPVILS